MAKLRRVIRKVPAPSQAVLDEQFWPVMLATFVLGGFLMGTVAAYLPFDAKHWWQNATTWMFVIPVATCIAVWLLRNVSGRLVRRALQVSFVLGLVFHVVMLVLSLEAHIFGQFFERKARPTVRRPQRELRIVNDYQEHQLDQQQRQQQEFMQPVETAVPEPIPEPVPRQQENVEQPPTQTPPMPAPQTPREIQRNAMERPTPAETRPRQSDHTSKLSRQRSESRPNQNEIIHAPMQAAPEAQATRLEARSENLQQQSPTTPAQRQQSSADPSSQVNAATPTIARRAAERAPSTDNSSSPALPRQVAQPSSVARSDVRAGESPSVSRQTAANELQPARTTARQQTTASPLTNSVEPASTPETSQVPTPSVARQQPNPSQPQVAQTPVPVANRQPRTTSRPDVASSAPNVALNATPAPTSQRNIEASSSTVQRSAATSIAASDAPTAAGMASTSIANAPAPAAIRRRASNDTPRTGSSIGSPTPRTANAAQVATSATAAAASQPASASSSASLAAITGEGNGLQRPVNSAATPSAGGAAAVATPQTTAAVGQPGERARANSDLAGPAATNAPNRLSRSTRHSPVATSTTAAETPQTMTAAAGSDEPQPRPSRLAMTQSLAGIAGVGQSANLDRSPSTPGSPSTTASGSARRAEATQNSPPGPALAPSAMAVARRSLVGADRPSASLRATAEGLSEAAGAERPAELNATSAASLVRQDANAAAGDITASKGTMDIDLGPTRVADAGGFERASGGGQPEVNLDSDSPTLARARSGGSAPSTMATTTVDLTNAAPAGQGEVASTEPSAGNTAARQQVATAGAGGSVTQPSQLQPAVEMGSSKEQVAATRATPDAALDVPEVGEPGGAGSNEDEEEKRRRLARSAASSVPAGSVAGPVQVDIPTTAQEPGAAEEAATLDSVAGGGGAPRQTTSSEGGASGSIGQIAASAVASGGNIVGEPTLQRAEATEAATGPALPGGGTDAPQRTATARAFAANVTANVPTIAGAPASSGSPRGSDVAAQGGEPSPTATGVLPRSTTGAAGAAAADMPRDATPESGVEIVSGLASRSNEEGDAPVMGDAPASGAPLERSKRTELNAGPATATVVRTPVPPNSVASTDAAFDDPSIGAGTGTARRQAAAALPVEVPSADGMGGLGDQVALDIGVNTRLSSPESVEVQAAPARFIRKEVGGAPELNTSAVFAADAFRTRTPARSSLPRGPIGAGGPQTEESIELGLSYLAKRQLQDGSWTLRSATEPVQLASDTAATGLCLLAFQGAGYNHREYKYATRVAAGIDYLVKHQKPDGDLFVPLDDISNRSVWLYSHAIAAIALCEAYGMTQDPELREPAQKALDFIIATQDRKGGGWRYQPGIESDTSVTGWMMMALKSGELAGLKVPRSTYELIGHWLDQADGSGDERHLYRYNPYAPDTKTQRHGRSPTVTMTAVGLLMRLYGGWRRDHPTMIEGGEYLRQHLPAIGTLREPLRDTYYWYYGTQVMFHMGGALWEEWNGQLHPLLLQSQIKQGDFAGSWSPRSPVPDRWAPHAGRLYVTTMNLLSLEVTYRHLPLYIDTAK